MILRLILITCVFVTPAAASDLRLIVDRDPDSIELFVQIPVPLIPRTLGALPDGFAEKDGVINIAPFRNGTADFGDAFFRNVQAQLDGAPVVFEAMSMMVHPKEYDLPFRDPIDAMVAISVCNVPDPLARFQQDTLTAYLGYIAYPVNGYGDLAITFPSAVNVDIVEFKNHRKQGAASIKEAKTIVVETNKWSGWLSWLN